MNILVAIIPVIAAALIFAYNKWGKGVFLRLRKSKLVEAIVEGLDDGKLTEDEAKRIISEIIAIFKGDTPALPKLPPEEKEEDAPKEE